MIPYVILILIPIIYRVVHVDPIHLRDDSGNIGTMTIFFVILWCMLACRAETIGNDTAVNLGRFEKVQSMTWSEVFHGSQNVEIGFLFILKLLSCITTAPQLFLALMAAIYLIPMAYLYCSEGESPMLAISIFLILPTFQMLFSGMKQDIAMAFAVPAFYLTKHRRLIPFIICVILASAIHASAWILLAMYPLYWAQITKKWLLVIVPIILIVYALNGRIFLYIIRLMGEKYIERYSTLKNTGAFTMLALFSFFAFLSYYLVDDELADEEFAGLRNFLLGSVVLQCFAPVNTIAMRANYYYLLFLPITISKICKRNRERFYYIVTYGKIAIAVFFLGYFMWKGFRDIDSLNIFPYVLFGTDE